MPVYDVRGREPPPPTLYEVSGELGLNPGLPTPHKHLYNIHHGRRDGPCNLPPSCSVRDVISRCETPLLGAGPKGGMGVR